jgi:hypothetical protein
MKQSTPIHRTALTAALLAGLSCVPFFPSRALGGPKPNAAAPQRHKQETPVAGNRLTIEVTGGENNVPVENASVYVKFVMARKLAKDKRYELNVKTNREGITHVPDAPLGKVLIQVIAEGWKTFGRWYEITEMKQMIQIHLEKPPRWY